jgi:hypothetical protein
MMLSKDMLKNLLQMIASTRPVEIGCDECFEQLGQFAEVQLAGKSPAQALPLVQEHLERCGDCREEYEALLDALKAGQLGDDGQEDGG